MTPEMEKALKAWYAEWWNEREECIAGILGAVTLLRGRMIATEDKAQLDRFEDCIKTLESTAEGIRERGKA